LSQWYVVLDGKREGPFSIDDLKRLAAGKPFPSDTLVWSEGMANWSPLNTTDLSRELASAIAPPSLPASVALHSASAAGAEAALGFVDAIKTCFRKYAVFEGRAGLAEYWWFFLFLVLCMFVVWIPFLGWLLLLALIIPSISVTVRRLHDTDRSGWWYLITFVPLVGFIVLVIFLVQKGTEGKNRFG
jgi:uncharacterized membrane protein YhaH (DUF805 family)